MINTHPHTHTSEDVLWLTRAEEEERTGISECLLCIKHLFYMILGRGYYLNVWPSGRSRSSPKGSAEEVKHWRWSSLVVQWLRLHASNARGTGSVPSWGAKIPHASGTAKTKTH